MKIRNIFNQCPVYCMSNTDDDRYAGCKYGTDHALVIERGKVVRSTATTGKDDDVDSGLAEQGAQGAHDALRGSHPLYLSRGKEHFGQWKTPANNVNDVVPRGAVLRGDNADHAR